MANEQNIPVKIGWEMLVIMILPTFWMIYEFIENHDVASIFVASFYAIFVGIVIFGIRYRIAGEYLLITNGFFWHNKIKIQDIFKIEKTGNMIAAPAPSLFGRVEIYFLGDSIVVSPKNIEHFSTELLKINPNISVKN